MAGGYGSKIKLGENIILGGLFFQIIIFGLFLVAAVVFHMRMRAHLHNDPSVKWEKMLLVLYAVSLIIMTRNIVRVVEYIGEGRASCWPTNGQSMCSTQRLWRARWEYSSCGIRR